MGKHTIYNRGEDNIRQMRTTKAGCTIKQAESRIKVAGTKGEYAYKIKEEADYKQDI